MARSISETLYLAILGIFAVIVVFMSPLVLIDSDTFLPIFVVLFLLLFAAVKYYTWKIRWYEYWEYNEEIMDKDEEGKPKKKEKKYE